MKILFSLLIIFLLPNLIRSQEILYISFGEKIVIGKIGEKYNYKIEYRNTSKTLTHSELNNYVFESPGDYQISPQEIITEKYFGQKINSEESIPIPLTFSVKVDSVRMNLNPLSIKINTPLKQNSSMTGAILTIEVEFTNYFNTPISFNNKQLKLEAAGIGAAVKGELIDPLNTITPGLHLLHYKLSGMFQEKGYIQFDFELFNGKIFPVGYHETVK